MANERITATDLEKWYSHTKNDRNGSIKLMTESSMSSLITTIGYMENNEFIPIDKVMGSVQIKQK